MEIIPDSIAVKPESIAIVGWHEGDAGQIDSWLEKYTGHHIACFVNPSDKPLQIDIEGERKKRECKSFSFPTETSFKNKPLITSLNWIDILTDLGIKKVLILTPDKVKRLEHINEASEKHMELISAIHPTAVVMDDVILHENVVLFPRTIVSYKAEVYPGVIVNTGAQIDHHNVIYHCAGIDPGVVTAGNVTVKKFAQIHTGAVIINKIRIGEGAIIGAGSVIIRDVPDYVTVVGVPGKIIKYRNRNSAG